jgi:multicomponent K+:H+ antiporter subunit A
VAYSLRFIHDVFFNGEPVDLPHTPHEPPRWMKVPVEVLVVLCLLVGIAPALTVEPLLAVAAASTLQGALPEYTPGAVARRQPGAGHERSRWPAAR